MGGWQQGQSLKMVSKIDEPIRSRFVPSWDTTPATIDVYLQATKDFDDDPVMDESVTQETM